MLNGKIKSWWLYEVRWRLSRWSERAVMWAAWHLPREIAYWCVIRVTVNAEPNANPSDVTTERMLKAWKP